MGAFREDVLIFRFKIFLNDEFIGESNLETGDPPMGVAYGSFFPAATYYLHREKFFYKDAESNSQINVGWALKILEPDNSVLENVAGVFIEDFTKEGLDEIRVSILGMDSLDYERYFPGRYSEYEKSFER